MMMMMMMKIKRLALEKLEDKTYFSFMIILFVFTALHVMQTRYCDENSVRPSVRLSVRLSVRRVICDKMEERSVQIFIPYEKTFSLVF